MVKIRLNSGVCKFNQLKGIIVNKRLKEFLKKNTRLTQMGYVLYATLATYFSCKYLALSGYPIGDTLATISAISFVPIVFMLDRIRRQATSEFEVANNEG